ncbi:hypothetical protein B0T10DRAFT_611943 [Thelonectria olida]|uniref:Uncharacterized protein n=1 Tax=Thelonectria olida TaxID=1576542 RepID=A0A9P9ADN3_9HYPO|nr:hypothetical protein B0T10DRAFT_611943 [Thelonectria olida]
MDPISLAVAVVAAIFAFTGPMLPSLWRRIRQWYGSACRSKRYLQQLGSRRVTNDVQRMLAADSGLRFAAQQYYVDGERIAYQDGDGYGSEFSDM